MDRLQKASLEELQAENEHLRAKIKRLRKKIRRLEDDSDKPFMQCGRMQVWWYEQDEEEMSTLDQQWFDDHPGWETKKWFEACLTDGDTVYGGELVADPTPQMKKAISRRLLGLEEQGVRGDGNG